MRHPADSVRGFEYTGRHPPALATAANEKNFRGDHSMTSRLFSLGTLIAACALLAPAAQAQFGGQPSQLELIKVRDDIYVLSNVAVPGLVTALITDEGVLLVDDKFEIDHDNIVALLKTVTNQPVKYVINTHYHGDHSGGNAKLQALGAIAISSTQ